MKLENQVVSLELAKKLKELGVRQESLFWYFIDGGIEFNPSPTQSLIDKVYAASAFTVAELGEMLPHVVKTIGPLTCIKSLPSEGKWLVGYDEDLVECAASAKTEANARAKMLIHLIETGIVNPSAHPPGVLP